MKQPLTNFKEEFSAKLPALTLLNNLGYTYLTPDECNKMRSQLNSFLDKASSVVILLPILRSYLEK